jgi:hypothetical protein
MNAEKAAVPQLPGVRELKSAIVPRPITFAGVSPSGAIGVVATLLIAASVWALSMLWSPGDKDGAGVVTSAAMPAKSPIAEPLPPATSEAGLAGLTAAAPSAAAPPGHRIRLSDNFAEIRLHRSALPPGGNALEWWTEAASAKPGIDYVPQGRAKWTFAKGEKSASFFIKLIPKASRAQSEVFYLAVAEVGHGGAGRIERTAIWLPAT